MTGVWWSYAPDAACLRESVAAFRRAAGDGCRVVIGSDAKAPVPVEVLREIGADWVVTADWKIPGRLAGHQHAWRAAGVYAEAARRFGGAGVVRVDSDLVYRRLDWIDEAADFHGWRSPRGPGVIGAYGFWISRRAAERIVEAKAAEWWTRDGEVESVSMFSWVAAEGLRVRLEPWDMRTGQVWHYHRPADAQMWRLRTSDPALVSFGHMVHGVTRDDAARAMTEFSRARIPDIEPDMPRLAWAALAGAAIDLDEYRALVRFCRDRGVRRVREYGPGDSTLAFLDAGCEVEAVETDPRWREIARRRFQGERVRVVAEPCDGFAPDVAFVDDGDRPAIIQREAAAGATVIAHDVHRAGTVPAGWHHKLIAGSRRGLGVVETMAKKPCLNANLLQ